MILVINIHPVAILRDALEDFRGQFVGLGELFVAQHQERLAAAPEETVNPDPVGLPGELRLDELERVGGAPQVAPFGDGFLAKAGLMPLREPARKLLPDHVRMRGDDDHTGGMEISGYRRR